MIVALLLMGCGGEAADSGAPPATDLDMQAEDFGCVTDMTRVGRYYVDNPLGHLDEAVAVASSPDGGAFPVGTVLQLISFEAMVKREPGWDPATNDWEFFSLAVSEEGTAIDDRGGAEVLNMLGGSCYACHAMAAPQWDFVCGVDHGCDPLGLSDAEIEVFQENDPRCD